MNRLEHLLTCVSEEAGEVVQAIGKIQRFSMDSLYPGTEINNFEQLRIEMMQLLSVYCMVCDEAGKESAKLLDLDLIQAKEAKITQYMEYSRNMGALEDG